ncbi:M48 family metallopeptidase [Candidatus Spongiihabitans sp.]|uniref:M48 family metallopeptidase n=1 Tax=Candidatus Spongiihabitans sp. TaxID=3101308 RepID=UPI003C703C4D
MEICGIWYPAGSSERRNATLLLDKNKYLLQMDDANQNVRPITGFVSELKTSQRVGNIPRRITFNDHSIFETQNNDKIDQWINLSGTEGKFGAVLHEIESKWRWIVSSLVTVILISFAGVNWGLPWSSQALARTVPDGVVKKVSSHTMSVLDKLFFESSQISADRQGDLETHFYALTQSLKKNQAAEFKLHFRKLGVANAFALPSGDIIISDELLAIIENQNQVDAVLLHEVGHVVNNHGLQQIIRSSIVSFVVAMIAGEPSGLGEMFVALPTFMLHSHYSREHEVEADLFALQAMVEKGIDPVHFAEVLKKIDPNLPKMEQEYSDQDEKLKQASPEDESVLDYFSSHPATSDRIVTVLEYSKRFRQKHN